MFSFKIFSSVMIGTVTISTINLSIVSAQNLRGLGSDHRALAEQHGCSASAGYSYCESLQKCIRPFDENCPVDGDGFHGEMTFECTSGQCSDLTCNVYDINNKITLQGPSLLGLTGDYYLPAGCSTTCDSNCEIKEFPNPQTDGHGCKASAGYSWCPETTNCIRFDENCPIEDGTEISGAKDLTCSEGARLSNLTNECDLIQKQDDGTSITLSGPYVSAMKGQYVLPEGCSATVVGCTTQNLMSF